MKQLHIALVNAGLEGLGDPGANDTRLDAFAKLLELARGKADLLALPAGYFTVPDSARIGVLRRKLSAILPQAKVPVIVGVDVQKNGALPGKVLAWTPGEGFVGPWAERALTEEDTEVRAVRVKRAEIGVLISREMFDADLRAAYREKVPAVIDVGHTGRGFTPHRGLRALTRAGGALEAFACAHLAEPGVQHWYRTGGEKSGSARKDLWVDGPPWLAAAIYEITLP